MSDRHETNNSVDTDNQFIPAPPVGGTPLLGGAPPLAVVPAVGSVPPVTATSPAVNVGTASPGTTAPTNGGTPPPVETGDVNVNEDADGYECHVASNTSPAIVSTTPPTGTNATLTGNNTSATGSVPPSTGAATPSTGAATPPAGSAIPPTPTGTAIQGNEHHHNFLRGGSHDANIHAGAMGDIIVGGSGNNTITGGDGDDIVLAGTSTSSGANIVNGGAGNDILIAAGTKTQQLNDFIQEHQSAVNAVLANSKLADLSTVINGAVNNAGGGATNVFQMHSGRVHDQIYNFHAASDQLQIQAGINGSNIKDIASLLNHVTVSGSNLTVDLGAGNTVTLVGVDVAHLSAANAAII